MVTLEIMYHLMGKMTYYIRVGRSVNKLISLSISFSMGVFISSSLQFQVLVSAFSLQFVVYSGDFWFV